MKKLFISFFCLISIFASSQKTVYSGVYYTRTGVPSPNDGKSVTVKFGPDRRIRVDYSETSYHLFTYNDKNPREFSIFPQGKKMVYTDIGVHQQMKKHEKTITNQEDTTILGYKCKKIIMKVVLNEGYGDYNALLTYYVTDELKYPQDYKMEGIKDFYMPFVDVKGFLLKGSFELENAPTKGVKAKFAALETKIFYYSSVNFNKIDASEFVSPWD